MDNSLDINSSFNRSLTNSQIYDGEFFDIVSCEGEILVVRCVLCTPDGGDGQLLRTSVKSNGNILKHIKRRHPEKLEIIKAAKSVKSRAPRAMKREMVCMEDMKTFKKKVVQIKVKKQPDDELLHDGDTQIYISNEDSMPANNEMYVVESCDMPESDPEDYLEFELDNNTKSEDRRCSGDGGGGDGVGGGRGSSSGIGIESIDENSLLTATEYEYVNHRSKPAAKRLRESTATPHEFTYKRVSTDDRSIIEFQKKLMQAEFDHMKKLRDEKHTLEIAILKADLTNKTLEHQKKMELLNKKLQE